jgi:quercetin dioxygenase-like cupin family protein
MNAHSLRITGFCLAALMPVARASDAEAVRPVFQHELPNVPGKTLTALEVDYAPGVKSAPHGHGRAFVYAYVLSGAIRSQLRGQPARVYHAGESWFEPPGADHMVSENASSRAPARLLAVFVADNGAPVRTPEPR